MSPAHHQAAAHAPLPYCVWSRPTPLTKTFALNRDGTVSSIAAANLYEGHVRRASAANLRDFARQLDALTPCEATTYGLAPRDARVVKKGQLDANPDAIARTKEFVKFEQGPGIMFLDSDAGIGIDELPALLCAAIPQLGKAAMLCRPSSSAGLVRANDGALVTTLGKWHLYVPVTDVSRVVQAGEDMQDLLWAMCTVEDFSEPGGSTTPRDVRLAWMVVNSAGQALPRTLLDKAVHQAERLDFVARAVLPAGLTRLDAGAIFINEDAPLFDLDSIRVTPEQHKLAEANRAAAREAVRDECERKRDEWLTTHVPRIAAARGLTEDDARDVLVRAVERAELTGDYMLLHESGEWVSVHDVWADRDKYPANTTTRFADPIEPDYRNDRRIAWLFMEKGQPTIYSHAHGSETRYTLLPDTRRLFGGTPLAANDAQVEDARIVALPAAAVQEPPALNPAQLAHLAPLAASEDGLALTFVERAASRHRWTPGPGWMVNTGNVWERDDCMQRLTLARQVCRAAAADADSMPEKRRLTSAKTIMAAVTLAQSDLRLIVPPGEWDADPLALNTPTGVVNLRDGTLHPRAGQLHTLCTSVGPDMTAEAPVFARFIDAVFLGDRELVEFVQRVLGYCLTADRREQVLLFWHGSGANGKSTLLDLLQWLMGTYSVKLAGFTLMTSRNERHPTEIAQLRGRRLACSSELEEGAFFNEPLLKELTGDATASARFMRGDFFEFQQTQKHVVVGNFKPRLRGGDPAMARRIVLVPFKATFSAASRDPLMLDKLKAEGPAILAWAIRGALAWQAQGLRTPKTVADASREYMALHDDVQLWRDECCTAGGETKASELYAAFKRWKEARGEYAPAATSWYQRLESQQGITKRRSDGIRYGGIALRGPAFGAAA